MESNKSEEWGEMYSPDNQGEYAPEVGMLSFSIQGLSDTLTALETVTKVQPLPEEFALQLEVMMADHPGHQHPPAFLWNADMVLHVLKSDPTQRDLEHVQMYGPGMAYLFFFDKQGHQGLTLEATHTIRTHMGEAFSEWISHSTHFTVNPMPLAEGWHCTMTASERQRQQSRMGPVSNLASSESDSTLPLVGSAPPAAVMTGLAEDMGCGWATRVPTGCP